MPSYTAGSVTAQIKLDTTEFKKAVESIKEEMKTLKADFKDVSLQNVAKSVSELEKEVSKLQKEQDKLSESIINTNKDFEKTEKSTKTIQSNLSKLSNTLKTEGNSLKKYSNNWVLTNKQIQNAGKALGTFERYLEFAKNNFNVTSSQIKNTSNALKTFEQINRVTESGFLDLNAAISIGATQFRQYKSAITDSGKGVDVAKRQLKEYEIQTKQTFETMQVELAKANAAQYKYWKQVRGQSSRNGIISTIGKGENKQTINWGTSSFNEQPLQIAGYSEYLSKILEINKALAEFKRQQQSVNDLGKYTSENFKKASDGLKLLNEQFKQFETTINQARANTTTLGNRVNVLKAELESLSNASNKNRVMFTNQSRQAQSLSTRLTNLTNSYRQGKIGIDNYQKELSQLDAELQKLQKKVNSTRSSIDKSNSTYSEANAELKRLSEGYIAAANSMEKTGLESKKVGNNIKNTGNSMNQTAHAGRILSNTLYQIRGALLSLKMIFTAMGGMALWGFASELAEGVQETFKAKNEMEATLRQNSKVDNSGIVYFNEQLDAMTDKFKKINKYSIGETVASIGLEFDLNAKQMAESLDIVSMIQSEYVRAGRTEEEAALAVKDILQGEFQRLSRETGVGKEELTDYGWNGDKKDVESLMDALRKAAKDRHWDLFAAKATSLNDVINITKSRFSEFGADMMQSATPLIVGAFNTIIGTIDKLKEGFNSMNPFMQNLTLVGGGTAIFGSLLTALPMITKGMGLADIATIGWGKSVATAVLNLNKAEVAQYGFRKALAATVAGVKANELAETRWTKAILGRVLGVNQSVMAQKGLLTALVSQKMALKNVESGTVRASVANGKWYQKLAYLTGGLKAEEAASKGLGTSLLRTATSFKVLRIAILGVIGIAAVAWFSSLNAWCQETKKNVDSFHNVVSHGNSLLKDAQKRVNSYEKSLEGLSETSDKYKRRSANLEIAKGNVKDLEQATKLAKQYNKELKSYNKSIDEKKQQRMVDSLKLAGLDYAAATEKASGYTDEVQRGYEAELKAYQVEDDRLYKASQHINERIGLMKEEGVSQDNLIKYAQEYSAQAEETAEKWKKFYQGDFNAGVSAILSELKLVWIDVWNNTAFINFWNGVKKTWKDLEPLAKGLADALIQVGEAMLNFFGTEAGRWVFTIGAMGTAIGLVTKKIYDWAGGTKSTITLLKDLGSKLKDAISKWRQYGDEVEKAKKKESDGTIVNQEGKVNKPPTTRSEWWQNTKGKLYQDATNYFRAAEAIAAAMLLVSEAILLLTVPMWSLAQTGKYFKSVEPHIRDGIEGLQLIAPVIAVFLPPVAALMVVVNHYGGEFEGLGKQALTAAEIIAEGMLLVAEAVLMMVAPMTAIALLGGVKSLMGNAVEQGKEAIKVTAEALQELYPITGIFIVAIAAGVIALTGVGFLGEAFAIAAGMLLVAEAVVSLAAPMAAIAKLGDMFPDTAGIQKGANAIKETATALSYISEAVDTLVNGLNWDLFKDRIYSLAGMDIKSTLDKIVEDGGVLTQLSEFNIKFKDFSFEGIDASKASVISNSANSITTIGNSLKDVHTALENVPDFNNNKPNGNAKTWTKEQVESTGQSTNYFDKIKQPIQELKDFADSFNKDESLQFEPIDPARIEAITSAANMITQVNAAVEKVKAAMGNAADTNWNNSMAEGGFLAAVGNFFYHDSGSGAAGDYVSSIGSSLQDMENIVKDINTFNTNIQGLTNKNSGKGGNIEGASNLVSILQTQINSLKTTLTDAVPDIKAKAKSIGTNIVTGVNEGLNTLKTDVSAKLEGMNDTFKSKGNSWGDNLSNGFKDNFKIKDIATSEVDNTLAALNGKSQEFYDKGYALGDAFQRGYKAGGGINSPGYAAQAMEGELGYMTQYINDAMGSIPNLAYTLSQNISSMLTPSLDLTSMQFPDITAWTTNLTSIIPTVNDVKTQVSTNFTNMSTSVGASLNSIAVNARTKYSSILSNTRSSLSGMQSATTKNIAQIKTSWNGMQTALIASAENIRKQTSDKINKLKSNMGDFWNKIKHPDQLVAAAGSPDVRSRPAPQHSIRRMRVPTGGAAGSNDHLFKPRLSNIPLNDTSLLDYIKCILETGKPCFAGGWDFNWTPSIVKKFKGWNTHFKKYSLDDFLNVGKFENSNFPVKGRADVAKAYIKDVIEATAYDFYYNSRYSPAEALRRKAFNCVDGARVAIAIASAFGFGGGGINYGTWNGIGHGWASIPGLGIIDATALQGGYGFKSPKVKGYGSPSLVRNSPKYDDSFGNTTNNVKYVTEVHLHGNIYGIDDLDKHIDKAVNKANRKLYANPLTGV